MKTCTICNVEKPISEFLMDKSAKGGYRNQCKECLRARNKNVWSNRAEGFNKAMRKFRLTWKGVTQTSLTSARGRSKKLGLPDCDLDNQYLRDLLLSQDYKCAISGNPLVPKGGWECPSLDKMDPTLGYTKGNVQWLTKRANLLKGNQTMEELYQLCTLILNSKKEIPHG